MRTHLNKDLKITDGIELTVHFNHDEYHRHLWAIKNAKLPHVDAGNILGTGYSLEEIQFLEKYGGWLHLLMTRKLLPITKAQNELVNYDYRNPSKYVRLYQRYWRDVRSIGIQGGLDVMDSGACFGGGLPS